ncbi:hypothetical protein SUNI508_12851 [Seiridium unicorne]|uniref:Uncharacterized protein n=1 Tax=Seiridium unicorne TaxID=138068 RepID=A0ABR2VG35_9PEZI
MSVRAVLGSGLRRAKTSYYRLVLNDLLDEPVLHEWQCIICQGQRPVLNGVVETLEWDETLLAICSHPLSTVKLLTATSTGPRGLESHLADWPMLPDTPAAQIRPQGNLHPKPNGSLLQFPQVDEAQPPLERRAEVDMAAEARSTPQEEKYSSAAVHFFSGHLATDAIRKLASRAGRSWLHVPLLP